MRSDSQAIGPIPEVSTANRFQSIFDAQRAHFLDDATKSFEWRMEQLDRMERVLREHQDEFCAALYQDFRKPPFEQLFEIAVSMGVICYYREHLKEMMAPQPVPLPEGLETTGNRGVILKEPWGVTPVIGLSVDRKRPTQINPRSRDHPVPRFARPTVAEHRDVRRGVRISER